MSIVTLRGPRDLKDTPVTPEFEYLNSASQRVNLRHPAYGRHHDLLLSLYAWDAAVGGICYSLAHDACAIIAGNRHEGWLTNSPGGDPLIYELDALLPAGDYWYYLPAPVMEDDNSNSTSASVYRWPVVPSFQSWEFPENLPSAWTTVAQRHSRGPVGPPSTYSLLVRNRDGGCRITNHTTGTQVAHLCPEQEKEWFQNNTMNQYNSNTNLDHWNVLNDTCNMILLRSDLHKAFDDQLFFLYPKNNDFTVHVMEPTMDIGLLYHNIRTHPITSCSPQFIYARFAWSIFPGISSFLTRGTTRSVITIKDIGGKWIKQVEEMNADTLQALLSLKNRSPTKRQRVALQTAQADEDDNPASKRRCINSSPFSEDDTNTSLISLHGSLSTLEDNLGLQKENQARKSSFIQEWEHFDHVRQHYLRMQRPAGFVPLTFENAKTVREKLESVGVEFIDDTSEEADDLSNACN